MPHKITPDEIEQMNFLFKKFGSVDAVIEYTDLPANTVRKYFASPLPTSVPTQNTVTQTTATEKTKTFFDRYFELSPGRKIFVDFSVYFLIFLVGFILFVNLTGSTNQTPANKPRDPSLRECTICRKEYRGGSYDDDIFQGMCKSCWDDFVKHDFSD